MILLNSDAFYPFVRTKVFDSDLTTQQFSGLQTLVAAVPARWPLSWAADFLGQVTWETNHTMQPVREAYWLSEAWRKANLRYWPYYGRGYVQLTWQTNYDFYGQFLKIGLVETPDLALESSAAAAIAVHGMETGRFTGKKLADFLPPDGSVPQTGGESAFYWCREIVNGLDHAAAIASIAENYHAALLTSPNQGLVA
jgi:putative chitinase